MKRKSAAQTVGHVILLLAVYFAAQTFAGVALLVGHVADSVGGFISVGIMPDETALMNEMMTYMGDLVQPMLVIGAALAALIYFLIYRKRKEDFGRFCTFRFLSPLAVAALAVFAVAFGVLLDFALELVFSALTASGAAQSDIVSQYGSLTDMLLSDSLLVTLVATGVVAPVFEEFLFRGLIFGELRKVMNVRAAIVVQALIFGVYHFNLVQSTYAVLIGLILGFLYYRSSSLFAPMIVHIAINTSNVLAYYLVSDEIYSAYLPYILGLGAVLAAASAAVILREKSFKNRMARSLADPAFVLDIKADPEPRDGEDGRGL